MLFYAAADAFSSSEHEIVDILRVIATNHHYQGTRVLGSTAVVSLQLIQSTVAWCEMFICTYIVHAI